MYTEIARTRTAAEALVDRFEAANEGGAAVIDYVPAAKVRQWARYRQSQYSRESYLVSGFTAAELEETS